MNVFKSFRLINGRCPPSFFDTRNRWLVNWSSQWIAFFMSPFSSISFTSCDITLNYASECWIVCNFFPVFYFYLLARGKFSLVSLESVFTNGWTFWWSNKFKRSGVFGFRFMLDGGVTWGLWFQFTSFSSGIKLSLTISCHIPLILVGLMPLSQNWDESPVERMAEGIDHAMGVWQVLIWYIPSRALLY